MMLSFLPATLCPSWLIVRCLCGSDIGVEQSTILKSKSFVRLAEGEANLDFQASAFAIAGLNAAAVDDCDSLRDGKAQTGSASLMFARFSDPIKRFKNAAEGVWRHALATIRHKNLR